MGPWSSSIRCDAPSWTDIDMVSFLSLSGPLPWPESGSGGRLGSEGQRGLTDPSRWICRTDRGPRRTNAVPANRVNTETQTVARRGDQKDAHHPATIHQAGA